MAGGYHELVEVFGLAFNMVKVWGHSVLDDRFDSLQCLDLEAGIVWCLCTWFE